MGFLQKRNHVVLQGYTQNININYVSQLVTAAALLPAATVLLSNNTSPHCLHVQALASMLGVLPVTILLLRFLLGCLQGPVHVEVLPQFYFAPGYLSLLLPSIPVWAIRFLGSCESPVYSVF